MDGRVGAQKHPLCSDQKEVTREKKIQKIHLFILRMYIFSFIFSIYLFM